MSEAGRGLRLEGVCRTFHQADRSLDVLREVSLTVESGELVALVGPSGAGKSTLLQISGLLEPPDRGEVYVDGRASGVLGDNERSTLRRHHIGFVYQYHHLLPEFSALENIVLPQMIAGIDKVAARQRASELLAAVGLAERTEHRPSQLSGGEQQRVAIARGLANRPSILLADEPTGNLDPDTAEEVFGMLLKLVREADLAAVIATHNLGLAERMDKRFRLEHGHVVETQNGAI